MNAFEQFLTDLGGLHDARVTKFAFEVTERSFSIEVDDIYSNFEDMPGYKGPKPARIKLMEISRLKISFDAGNDEFNIDDFSVVQINENQGAASIVFWPEGKITINFRGVEFLKNRKLMKIVWSRSYFRAVSSRNLFDTPEEPHKRTTLAPEYSCAMGKVKTADERVGGYKGD